jgi:hypothetical protein
MFGSLWIEKGRIFWLALVGYAVWLTIVLRHAIDNNKPLRSLLVLSIVPPCCGRSALAAEPKMAREEALNLTDIHQAFRRT